MNKYDLGVTTLSFRGHHQRLRSEGLKDGKL